MLPHQVVLRPIGSPMPLGIVGLAVGGFFYAGFQLGWTSPAERDVLGALLIAFPVPLQLVASVLSFQARDGVAATALGILAVSWLSVGVTLILTPPGATVDTLGLLLLASAAALTLSASATALSKLVPAAVLLVAAARFGIDGIFQLGGGEGWRDASGAVGLGVTALALYCAWAMEVNDAKEESVLPFGRRALGAVAMTGTEEQQVRGVEREAGVRKRL